VSKWGQTSWKEYIGKELVQLCNKDIILNRFNKGRSKKYKKFVEDKLSDFIGNKILDHELAEILLEK